jgi:hypothetical protein
MLHRLPLNGFKYKVVTNDNKKVALPNTGSQKANTKNTNTLPLRHGELFG